MHHKSESESENAPHLIEEDINPSGYIMENAWQLFKEGKELAIELSTTAEDFLKKKNNKVALETYQAWGHGQNIIQNKIEEQILTLKTKISQCFKESKQPSHRLAGAEGEISRADPKKWGEVSSRPVSEEKGTATTDTERAHAQVEKIRQRGNWNNICGDLIPEMLTFLPGFENIRLHIYRDDDTHHPWHDSADFNPESANAGHTLRLRYNGSHYDTLLDDDQVIEIKPDGDCFFRAVLQALTPKEHQEIVCRPGPDDEAISVLRNKVADWFLASPERLAYVATCLTQDSTAGLEPEPMDCDEVTIFETGVTPTSPTVDQADIVPQLCRWTAVALAKEIDGLNQSRMTRNNLLTMRDIGERIPKIAHYIWLGAGTISNDSISNIIDFKKNNPLYSVNLWVENSDAMKNTLIERGYSSRLFDFINIKIIDKFDSKTESAIAREKTNSPLKNYAAASDIIRLALLYKYGGIYMDVDVLINGPLGNITPQKKSINRPPSVLVYRLTMKGGHNYSNAMIASVCEAPEMAKMLKYATSPYNGCIYDMGFAITSGNSGIHHLAASAQALGTSLDEIMWATKRYDCNTRFDATIMITGPGVMASFIDASGLSSRMAEIKVFSKEIIDKAGKRIYPGKDEKRKIKHPLGTWEYRFNGESKWASTIPLHLMKSNEV